VALYPETRLQDGQADRKKSFVGQSPVPVVTFLPHILGFDRYSHPPRQTCIHTGRGRFSVLPSWSLLDILSRIS
jgi:hypothetical protein